MIPKKYEMGFFNKIDGIIVIKTIITKFIGNMILYIPEFQDIMRKPFTSPLPRVTWF